MKKIDLKSFINAIARSITDVQKQIEKKQLENTLQTYFKKNESNDSYIPKTLELDLSSLNQPDKSIEKYQVPNFTLVNHCILHIEEASIAFELGINSIDLDNHNNPNELEKYCLQMKQNQATLA